MTCVPTFLKDNSWPADKYESSLAKRPATTINSCLNDISLGAASLLQLQLVMEQSAERRHNHANLDDACGDEKEARGEFVTDRINEHTGSMDMETDMDPIDRSTTHLLFHRPETHIQCLLMILCHSDHPERLRSLCRDMAAGLGTMRHIVDHAMVQKRREGFVQKVQEEQGEGWSIHGSLEVDKVAGKIHFSPGKSFHIPGFHLFDFLNLPTENCNMSHMINKLTFGDSIPGIVNALDGVQWMQEPLMECIGILSRRFQPYIPVLEAIKFSQISSQ